MRAVSSRLMVSSDGITPPGGNRGASFDPVLMEITGLVTTVTDPSLAVDLVFSGVPFFTSSRISIRVGSSASGRTGCHRAHLDPAKQDVRSRRQPARISEVRSVGNARAPDLGAAYVIDGCEQYRGADYNEGADFGFSFHALAPAIPASSESGPARLCFL